MFPLEIYIVGQIRGVFKCRGRLGRGPRFSIASPLGDFRYPPLLQDPKQGLTQSDANLSRRASES